MRPQNGDPRYDPLRRPSERETVVVTASSATDKAFMSYGKFCGRDSDEMDESTARRPQNGIKPGSAQAEPECGYLTDRSVILGWTQGAPLRLPAGQTGDNRFSHNRLRPR